LVLLLLLLLLLLQTIYLIRHGEGWHNIGYAHNLDAHLTPRGWAQTAAMQQHLQTLQPQLGIEVTVTAAVFQGIKAQHTTPNVGFLYFPHSSSTCTPCNHS
jgi:phosphohistidine phosphatase SixA